MKPLAIPQRSAQEPSIHWLVPLLFVYVLASCVSLRYVGEYYGYLRIVSFDSAYVLTAAINVAVFATVSVLFIISRFSFGYFVGFYLYGLMLGYAWLAGFATFQYEHLTAVVSAFVSILAFLAPALFFTPSLPKFSLSDRTFHRLLSCILVVSAMTAAAGACYNFKVVGIRDIYQFRNQLEFPEMLRYAVGITVTALLPFAFASFAARENWWRAGASLLLLLLFYPVTLTKTTLFAPFWLVFLMLLCRFCEARVAVVLSLTLPLLAGLATVPLIKIGILARQPINNLFGAVNFRMMASPSMILDVYDHFFASHDLTHFCQVRMLKSLIGCPYTDPLSIVMEKSYQVGSLNASLFATEGIASVGPILAPISALACGLIISLANRTCSHLSSTFVVVSSGVLVQAFLNIPFTTTLLTNGGAILFLLWYVTPHTALYRTPAAIENDAAATCHAVSPNLA